MHVSKAKSHLEEILQDQHTLEGDSALHRQLQVMLAPKPNEELANMQKSTQILTSVLPLFLFL